MVTSGCNAVLSADNSRATISNPLVAGSNPAGRANPDPVCGPPCKDETQADAVELALAVALQEAAAAGAWSSIERLAGELEARRKARLGVAGVAEVIPLTFRR